MSKASKGSAVVSVEKHGEIFAIHFADKSYIMLSGAQLADCFLEHSKQKPKKTLPASEEKK
jgi:hypothetical protein